MRRFYRIEELNGDQWSLIEPHQKNLSREECREQLNIYLNQGKSPETIRIISENPNRD